MTNEGFEHSMNLRDSKLERALKNQLVTFGNDLMKCVKNGIILKPDGNVNEENEDEFSNERAEMAMKHATALLESKADFMSLCEEELPRVWTLV